MPEITFGPYSRQIGEPASPDMDDLERRILEILDDKGKAGLIMEAIEEWHQ